MQTVLIHDKTGKARFHLWQKHVGTLTIGKTYSISNAWPWSKYTVEPVLAVTLYIAVSKGSPNKVAYTFPPVYNRPFVIRSATRIPLEWN